MASYTQTARTTWGCGHTTERECWASKPGIVTSDVQPANCRACNAPYVESSAGLDMGREGARELERHYVGTKPEGLGVSEPCPIHGWTSNPCPSSCQSAI